MNKSNRLLLAGSEREPVSGARRVAAVNSSAQLQITVVLRRPAAVPPIAPAAGEHLSRAAFAAAHGADPADMAAVIAFAKAHGLKVIAKNPASRSLKMSGTVEALQKAFGTKLGHFKARGGIQYRGRTGALSLPPEVHPLIVAVLGLDDRPVAKPHFRQLTAAAPSGAFTPPQLAALYNFPTGVTGSGQTVAIIELGGGYKSADLSAYFKSLGIKKPKVSAVSVDGGKNTPGSDADGEVMLDIEVVGAIAPGAAIAVYFAPNTDQGFVDAIAQAVHDTKYKPSVVSISWGGPEDSWTAQARDALNSALQDAASLGVTVTVAAGDDGSTDGAADNAAHVDFPAASPYALACGGTKLVASGSTITSEQVWNELAAQEGATGGGVSRYYPLPDYQKSAKVPKQPQTKFAGRGVPDVAGDADPVTGYIIRLNGQSQVIGGTSAVAPLWAGLVALMNQKIGKPLGFLNPALYAADESVFRDITVGNNGAFKATKAWDACTGCGSPNGAALLKALQTKPAAKKR